MESSKQENQEKKNDQGNTEEEEHPEHIEGETEEEKQRRDAEWHEKQEKQMPIIVTDKTSVLLTRSHDDAKGSEDCSYCHGKRTLYSGEEEKDLKYHKLGFTTNKFKVSDYETLLQ